MRRGFLNQKDAGVRQEKQSSVVWHFRELQAEERMNRLLDSRKMPQDLEFSVQQAFGASVLSFKCCLEAGLGTFEQDL